MAGRSRPLRGERPGDLEGGHLPHGVRDQRRVGDPAGAQLIRAHDRFVFERLNEGHTVVELVRNIGMLIEG